MRKRWLQLAAVPVALAFVAAACSTQTTTTTAVATTTGGDDGDAPRRRVTPKATTAPAEHRGRRAERATTGATGQGADLAGTEVTVFGSESSEEEAGAHAGRRSTSSPRRTA